MEAIQFRIADSEKFQHLEDPDYIAIEWDDSLQQDIVLVKQVCWLQFLKKIPTCCPGHYSARLHMYLGEDTVWPQTTDSNRTYIIITEVMNDYRVVLIEENMSSNVWNAIISSRFNNNQLSNSYVVPDSVNSGWYYFEFEPFKVNENSNLEFEFGDIENPNWKRNIKFGSIELTKLNMDNISFRVADSEKFQHLEDPDYITIERDDALQQDVVFVKNVCWLQFSKKMPVCSPGQYHARLHIYLGADTVWPLTTDNHRSYIKITEIMDDYKVVLVEENVPSNIWNAIISSRFSSNQLSHSSIVPDSLHPGWYFLKFEPFKVNKKSNLEFEFGDIENPNWKKNIKFNSVELIQLFN